VTSTKSPGYRLSELAEDDLAGILDYTLDTWGAGQADRYLDLLVLCFERIVGLPSLGRRCDAVRSGYRRIEIGKHVIFYRTDEDGVFIVRVLHQRELVTREALMERRR
jgi:toxin ParE1/3/4